MKLFFSRRSRANAATLRTSRKALKSAALDAKNYWIKSKHNDLNNMSSFGGTKSCWDALTQLRNGLSKTRPSTERTMKKEDGSLCKTPQENADVFHTHFNNLYGLFFSHLLNNTETRKTLVFGEIGISPGCISRTSMMQLLLKRYLRDRLFKGTILIQTIKKLFLLCQGKSTW